MTQRQKRLKNSKQVWAVIWSFCLVFIVSAPAWSSDKQVMIYEVYAGGIHAVQTHITIDMSKKDRYSFIMEAKTRGFLGRLAPWHGIFETHGWVMKDGTYRPELHRSTTIWKDETEIKSYNYAKDGSFKSLIIKDHNKPEKKKDVDDKLTQGTIDIFTAILSALSEVTAGKTCVGVSDIFDGKRRFKQEFKTEGQEALVTTRYNIFEGDTELCTVEVTPLAGPWHKKPRGWLSIQEQGRERGTMPTVWIGQMRKDSMAIPVKIRVKTKYGTLFMHLAEYQNGDEVLVAKKRVKD